MMKNTVRLLSLFLLVGLVFSSMLNLSTSAQAYLHFDVYENLSLESELGRLDNFSIALRRNPEMLGYIVFYVGQRDSYKRVKRRIERGVNHLVGFRKFDRKRLVIVYAGRRDRTMTILQEYEKNSPLLKEFFPEGKIINYQFKALNR